MRTTTHANRHDPTRPVTFEGERLYRVTATYPDGQTETHVVAADSLGMAQTHFMVIQTADFPSMATITFDVVEVTWYVANVLGEGLIDFDSPPESDPNPLVVGEQGEFVYVLYGTVETGVTVAVAAADPDDAERLILAAFGDDATIDSVDVSTSQQAPEVRRVVLVHLNVEVPSADTRTPDEIADALLGALEVGSDDDSVSDLRVVCPFAEEV